MDLTQLVDQWYEMDPSTDDLLETGHHLKNGMIVLIEDPHLRFDITKTDPAFVRELRMANRWCTVTKLKSLDESDFGDTIMFTAVYFDGTKRRREVHSRHAWLVKTFSPISSLPGDFEIPPSSDWAQGRIRMLPGETAMEYANRVMKPRFDLIRKSVPDENIAREQFVRFWEGLSDPEQDHYWDIFSRGRVRVVDADGDTMGYLFARNESGQDKTVRISRRTFP